MADPRAPRSRSRFALFCLLAMLCARPGNPRKVCVGTENRLSLLSTPEMQFRSLRRAYTGCQLVQGNLEITNMGRHHDLSFLKSIQEVSGYVLVALNEVEEIPLENLHLIRGARLYMGRYALAVMVNYNKAEAGRVHLGLHHLNLHKLTEILIGGVYIMKNRYLCHVNTIDWKDIVSPRSLVHIEMDNTTVCPHCHPQCRAGCWGQEEKYCQTLTRRTCAPQCDGRCFGPDPSDCCHKECASGCSGPRETSCFACTNFNDSGECVAHCPPLSIYEPTTFQHLPNPKGKFSFGATCVKQCPYNFVVDRNSCVRACPHGKMEIVKMGQTVCEACPGTCPMVCDGIGVGALSRARAVDASNIDTFRNCSKIQGNVVFLISSFEGDKFMNIPPLDPAKISFFKTVKEITGYLMVQSWPANVTDLSVFENLVTIRGRSLRNGHSLQLIGLQHVTSLGFRSLREFSAGDVYFHDNSRLCYFHSVAWHRLFTTRHQAANFSAVRSLANCKENGFLCDRMCSSDGCWGPGPTQCLTCLHNRRGQECVPSCYTDSGLYREYDDSSECRPCHSECLPLNGSATCTGPGPSHCIRCANMREGEECVERCPVAVLELSGLLMSRYSDSNGSCLPCHPNCSRGCFGPLENDCRGLLLKVITPPASGVGALFLVVTIVGGLIIFVSLLICCVLTARRRSIARRRAMRRFVREEELVQPLTPSGVAPNQAQLRILKETELRRGRELGSGAFGTVHKGVWVPEGEVVKIPVAIKVLREGTSPRANKEILDEAYVMASVEHPHLVRLLGVCLAPSVQLITQLMPLGCLLEYARRHSNAIGSQLLLNWAVQISKGMLYLEERRLVHRDLAARNVLVKNPQHVKITDFGLARLLDVNQDEYQADSGKMPIKWMALESIQFRIFTHQSDVWSYGVTVWELMTFGGKPYEGIPAREIPELLENGERLPQPPICTIDVYMILVKCWMIDADSRPRFRELANEFSRMARDPQRYLVIQGDKSSAIPSPGETKHQTSGTGDTDDDITTVVDAEEYLVPKQQRFFEEPAQNGTTERQPQQTQPPPPPKAGINALSSAPPSALSLPHPTSVATISATQSTVNNTPAAAVLIPSSTPGVITAPSNVLPDKGQLWFKVPATYMPMSGVQFPDPNELAPTAFHLQSPGPPVPISQATSSGTNLNSTAPPAHGMLGRKTRRSQIGQSVDTSTGRHRYNSDPTNVPLVQQLLSTSAEPQFLREVPIAPGHGIANAGAYIMPTAGDVAPNSSTETSPLSVLEQFQRTTTVPGFHPREPAYLNSAWESDSRRGAGEVSGIVLKAGDTNIQKMLVLPDSLDNPEYMTESRKRRSVATRIGHAGILGNVGQKGLGFDDKTTGDKAMDQGTAGSLGMGKQGLMGHGEIAHNKAGQVGSIAGVSGPPVKVEGGMLRDGIGDGAGGFHYTRTQLPHSGTDPSKRWNVTPVAAAEGHGPGSAVTSANFTFPRNSGTAGSATSVLRGSGDLTTVTLPRPPSGVTPDGLPRSSAIIHMAMGTSTSMPPQKRPQGRSTLARNWQDAVTGTASSGTTTKTSGASSAIGNGVRRTGDRTPVPGNKQRHNFHTHSVSQV
uniref:epidermal growth factor receptor-like isoform X2 n=1 Tax=Myxine glutinosa TaxID=7769 RepID=UPI00358DDC9F